MRPAQCTAVQCTALCWCLHWGVWKGRRSALHAQNEPGSRMLERERCRNSFVNQIHMQHTMTMTINRAMMPRPLPLAARVGEQIAPVFLSRGHVFLGHLPLPHQVLHVPPEYHGTLPLDVRFRDAAHHHVG